MVGSMENAFNFGVTTLYRALNHGRTYPEQKRYKKDVKLAQEKAQALEQRPAPLPSHRINLSLSDLSLQNPQQSQPYSKLFQKLPPEVRARIWEEVLGRSALRFETTDKGIKHRRLPHSLEQHRARCCPALRSIEGAEQSTQFVDVRVLRTCHAVYAECMPILWGNNTIAMYSPLAFLYLHDYILPSSHFNQIRHLCLEWTYVENPEMMNGRYSAEHDEETWRRFWDLAAQMGLQSLSATVEYLGPPYGAEGENPHWTEPMFKVHGVQEVHCALTGLPWSRDSSQSKEQLEREIKERWTSEA